VRRKQLFVCKGVQLPIGIIVVANTTSESGENYDSSNFLIISTVVSGQLRDNSLEQTTVLS
jgi:hypothetical protein